MQVLMKYPLPKDEHGDPWPDAVVRLDTIRSYGITERELTVQDDDSYKSELSKESSAPYKITYSAQFWSRLDIRQKGNKPRQFKSIDEEVVFEIDLSEPDIMAQWGRGPEDEEQGIIALAQWHFKAKVAV